MADAVLTVLLLVALCVTVVLALRALRHWYGERAGRAYELPVDRRGTALRAGASGAAALLAGALAVPLLLTSGAADPRTGAVVAGLPQRVPSPPARTPRPAPPPPEVRTLGHPAGGILQVLRDGTRVWLPPRYDTPRAARVAYPVVLAHVTADAPGLRDLGDLYAAFARRMTSRRADPFLLVTPPSCGTDPAAVLAEVAGRYRALTARTARAVVGIGAQAPCAVRETLAHPARYGAGAGISGTYPPLAPPAGPYLSLLLATASGETAARASTRRLRLALRPVGDEVRVVAGTAGRRDLFAVLASYLTEKLDGPARVAARPVPTFTPVVGRAGAVGAPGAAGAAGLTGAAGTAGVAGAAGSPGGFPLASPQSREVKRRP